MILFSVPPDQDHLYLLKQKDDIDLLKVKVISMEIEIKKKDTVINEKKNELHLAKEMNVKINVM